MLYFPNSEATPATFDYCLILRIRFILNAETTKPAEAGFASSSVLEAPSWNGNWIFAGTVTKDFPFSLACNGTSVQDFSRDKAFASTVSYSVWVEGISDDSARRIKPDYLWEPSKVGNLMSYGLVTSNLT